ncbi:MAG TPA: ElyC/SanA/YdcF family protein, partial [Actinomycetota bacterium]|nr:ElyC/SanA/YdcF family protein [Actinomycetota bacterium]
MKRVLIVSGSLLALVAGAAYVSLNVGRWMSAPDPLRPVDAIVVPSGDHNRRLPTALGHVRAGLAPELWVTVERGGPVVDERAAVRAFAPDARILGTSRSVRQDAALVAEHASGRPTIAVVTSPWTVSRVRITYERVLGQHADVLVWSDGSRYEARRWWRSEPETTAVEAVKLVGTLM